MEYKDLTIFEIMEGIKSRQFTCEELVKYYIDRCEKYKDYNAVIEIYSDAIDKAKLIDEKIKKGESLGKLAGVPIVIKDNILYEGKVVSCASQMLKDFVAPYSATIVEKLLREDAIIIGRANMDEFAMGGSCENSIYGACHNANDFDYVSGGSSGGSAVAVALGLCPVAIGTDTGGSIRQPASYNGVVGVKCTYGRVSRYGIVAFASSLDQASPITKTIDECKYVLDIMSGSDIHDSTTLVDNTIVCEKEKFTIGIVKQVMEKFKDMAGYKYFVDALNKLKNYIEIKEVDVEHITNSLACYYIIAPAEATSNLARFDGLKYTSRFGSAKDLESLYTETRSAGFGKEVKRRIMLGNFVLSSGYFDAYYNKAKGVQKLIRKEFERAFDNCDAIILPTTTGTAFKIGEKISNPIEMYMEDLFTVPANIAGIPAMSIPYAKIDNLPLGLQILCGVKQEDKMFKIAKVIKKIMEGETC